jgi:transposase InsO family protein
LVKGLPHIDHVDQVCDSCLAGKQRRATLPTVDKFHAEEKLELVHGDLCGPVTPTTPRGKRYFFLLVDDVSRYMWLVLLAMKDEALAAFTAFQARAEAEAGRKIGTLHTDRGGEFTARSFTDHSTKQGMQRHLTAPYTPEQNGVMERRNQSVMGMTRNMMKAMSMLSWFWGEAVLTAVFILNRSPTQSIEGRTPYEVWHGKKPSVDYFRTFGYVAHVKQRNKRLGKLEDRSTMMVFIGYEPGSKAWRFYNPVTRRVHVSCDAVFEEDRAWSWNEDEIGDDEPFRVEYIAAGDAHPTAGDNAWPDSPLVTPEQNSPVGSSPGSAAMPTRGSEPRTAPVPEAPGAVEHVTPPTDTPDLDEEADGAPLHFRMLADLLGMSPRRNADDTQLKEELLAAIGDEPATAEEALKTEEWRAVMMEELGSIKENKIWSFVDLPRGQKAIGLKWVFKLKHDEHGDVVKHKARLVAKGYVQRQGIDFDEVFAPVARMKSVRVMIILAAHLSWSVHHMDVKSAFLNGDLGEEVYVSQPPRFIVKDQEQKVYKLHKALYGLRQAPRA